MEKIFEVPQNILTFSVKSGKLFICGYPAPFKEQMKVKVGTQLKLKDKENKREVVSERDTQEFLANGKQLKRRNCCNRAEELGFQRATGGGHGAGMGRAWGGAKAESEALGKGDNLTLKTRNVPDLAAPGTPRTGMET